MQGRRDGALRAVVRSIARTAAGRGRVAEVARAKPVPLVRLPAPPTPPPKRPPVPPPPESARRRPSGRLVALGGFVVAAVAATATVALLAPARDGARSSLGVVSAAVPAVAVPLAVEPAAGAETRPPAPPAVPRGGHPAVGAAAPGPTETASAQAVRSTPERVLAAQVVAHTRPVARHHRGIVAQLGIVQRGRDRPRRIARRAGRTLAAAARAARAQAAASFPRAGRAERVLRRNLLAALEAEAALGRAVATLPPTTRRLRAAQVRRIARVARQSDRAARILRGTIATHAPSTPALGLPSASAPLARVARVAPE